jgi:hypothetical protein
MSAARPLCNKTIDELEALHFARLGDEYLNRQLLDELKHRSPRQAGQVLDFEVEIAGVPGLKARASL